MSLLPEELFQMALNVQDPWFIEKIDFSPDTKRLDIWIDFIPGSRFDCPECNIPECSPYDTNEKIWRHLNFFQFKTYLHCRVPRVQCKQCGIQQVTVPWAREQSGFTLWMDALMVLLARKMTISAIAEHIDEHDTRIWRVIGHYVEEALSQQDLSSVTSIGIDETACTRGHKYVSLVVNLDDSKVIHISKGKDASVVSSFKEDFSVHKGNPENVQQFCCDMSPAFIKGIEENFPSASITFDKFHVMKIMNEAVDAVRREEQAINQVLRKTRFIWLKNPNNLTERQQKELGSLKDMNLKTVRAYNIKMSLAGFWNNWNSDIAGTYLKRWYFWATHSKLKPIVKAAKTMKRHWDGIMNYIDSRISNGVLEGINSIVQSLKASARGYRNISNFMTMIYIRCGDLHFRLPT
jgi:transposase